MHDRHILVADDNPDKLAYLTEVTQGAAQGAHIHVARSAREAMGLIERLEGKISAGVIDYDFEGETQCGADIIRALRKTNAMARITLATARDGTDFAPAEASAIEAGATDALSTAQEDFESRVASLVSAA